LLTAPIDPRYRSLGNELVGVYKHQIAGVQLHRPPSGRVSEMLAADIDGMGRHLTEILDHSAADIAVRSRIDTHPHIHRYVAIAGITSRPASAFITSSHPSSP